jgi:phenylacetic acid degradation operon negative regulatory protein
MAQTQNLILRVVAQRGEISSGELLEMMQKFQLSPDAVRAAANRMVRSGLLTKIGRGRGNVRYTVGPQGQVIVGQFINKFVRYHMAVMGQMTWDGKWLVVTFSIPEEHRDKRDSLRTQLTDLGFGLLSSSVWIAPTDQEVEIKAAIEELALHEHVALLRCESIWMPGLENDRDLAHLVWRLQDLEAHYRDLNRGMKRLMSSLEQIEHGETVDIEALFFEAMSLQGELMEIILNEDPCLPLDLLPVEWLGKHVHDLGHELSSTVARLEIADDERYHYLFHALQGMEVLESFMPEGDESFHWPEPEEEAVQ